VRHRRTRHKLNRSASHRKALGANLATALLTHGRITTTLPKARFAREVAEKAITLGKDGSLHARRQAVALLRNKDVTYALFDRIAPAFADVNGGYTRILKLGPRPGDAAEMVLLELTEDVSAAGEATEEAEEAAAES
jgi:large subunit ribosomal protein L17